LIGFTLRPKTTQGRRNIPVIAIFALILTLGPGASLLRSLTLAPKLSVYAASWDDQDRQIRLQAAEGVEDVVVQPLALDLPQSVGLDTIGTDATLGANPCAADYYGVQTLIAE
jgi:hypothetical protein